MFNNSNENAIQAVPAGLVEPGSDSYPHRQALVNPFSRRALALQPNQASTTTIVNAHVSFLQHTA
jgi:hypothetical protein